MVRTALRRVTWAALATAPLACGDGGVSDPRPLAAFWPSYLERYVDAQGYVLDPRRDGGRVTSEGQGYALLRAVWERDEDTFRRLAAWTRARLQRPDGLHAWLWSPEGGGRIVDRSSATDGDLEIAWALLLGAEVFGGDDLRERAVEILTAVRTHARLELADGGWFPAAGDWAVEERITNLSYFVPYAHPWFGSVDPGGAWDRVTEVGYDLLGRALEDPSRRLPPAFIRLDPGGALRELSPESGLETEFSFDAIRTFWRVEADCRMHGRPEACGDPLGVPEALGFLIGPEGIASRYAPDGTRLTDDQSLTFYAALLAPARRHAPAVARDLIEARLDSAGVETLLAARDRYYDHNWVWFGLALDRGLIEARTPSPP